MIVVTDNGPVVVEPTRPTAPRRNSFAIEWTGTDGTTWDLTRGPVYLTKGARGFGMPTPQHWYRDSMGDGSSWNGLRIPARDVVLPVAVAPGSDFLAVDRAFIAGLNPRGTGTLRVTQPTGEWREITLRYKEGADEALDVDPLWLGQAKYPLTFVAEDPYWRGEPVVQSFRAQTDVAARPTFPPVGDPLALYFKRADTLDGEGEITNPGDVDAQLKTKVVAPLTGFSVGVYDNTDDRFWTVDMSLEKASGHVLIDTTGGMTTMVDESGANVRAFATDFLSAPIEPKVESRLKLEVYGPGAGSVVEVSFAPPYYRAW